MQLLPRRIAAAIGLQAHRLPRQIATHCSVVRAGSGASFHAREYHTESPGFSSGTHRGTVDAALDGSRNRRSEGATMPQPASLDAVTHPGLAGQVALVTGATSGIGRACALTLGRAGVAVAVNHRPGSEARAAEVV